MLQQQQQQQQSQLQVSCEECKQPIKKRGTFYIINNEIKYFHIDTCKKTYNKKNRHIVTCARCSKQVTIYPSEYKKIISKKWKFYCSNKCQYRQKGDFSLYDKYNFCDKCEKWILKEDSILRKKGSKGVNSWYTTKMNIYRCPQCNNRLRVNSRKQQQQN